jgi:hypothetical protein
MLLDSSNLWTRSFGFLLSFLLVISCGGDDIVEVDPTSICTPEARRCDGLANTEKCNTAGTAWERAESCASGHACNKGSCTPLICTLGQLRCQGAETVKACNSSGTAWDTTDCNSGYGCHEGRCISQMPSIPGCTASGQTRCAPTMGRRSGLDRCFLGEDGLFHWEIDVNCGPKLVCKDGECVSLCTPGVSRCDGLEDTEKCNTTGTAWEHADICASGHVCNKGRCVSQLPWPACTAEGQTRCWMLGMIEKCFIDVDGEFAWEFDRNCGTGLVCEDGQCVSR